MNILQVIPYFVPAGYYGGPIQIAYGVSRELVRRGHKVTVFTTDTLDAARRVEPKEEIMDGIEVRRFRNLSNNIAARHKIFLSPGIFTAEIKPGSYDIIHMHEYRSLQNIAAHRYAVKYGIPYVLEAYGGLPSIMSKQSLKQVFDVVWGYRLLKDASRLIAMTPTEVEQYKKLGVEEARIVQIPNTIDTAEYTNLPEKGKFRKKYGITEERIILFLARLNKIKGLDILLTAFASLLKEMEGVKLVLCGSDDGYLPAVSRMIQNLNITDKVIMTGFISGRAKLEAYVDADVYVLPSIYETFPTTVLEAGACGAPVVITDRCQIAPLVENLFGLVTPYNSKRLRDTLRRILLDEKMRNDFSRTGRKLVMEKYSWASGAAQTEAVYQEVLKSREAL